MYVESGIEAKRKKRWTSNDAQRFYRVGVSFEFVHHLPRNDSQTFKDHARIRFFNFRFIDRFVHAIEPSARPFRGDREWQMAPTQAWMAAFLQV